jgi:hypothetical protein
MRSEADVFITNVRTDGLTRAGFNYDDIKEEFPHLVRSGATRRELTNTVRSTRTSRPGAAPAKT